MHTNPGLGLTSQSRSCLFRPAVSKLEGRRSHPSKCQFLENRENDEVMPYSTSEEGARAAAARTLPTDPKPHNHNWLFRPPVSIEMGVGAGVQPSRANKKAGQCPLDMSCLLVYLVAGVGFEPTAFGL